MTQTHELRVVRRASRLVNWQITAAATLLVVVIVVASIVFIYQQSQPRELLEVARPGENKIYIDAREAVVAVIIAGALGVAFAAVVSWLVARRAVRPLGTALRIQQRFVSDASHELRTPLTVLDARLQLLARDSAAGRPDPNGLAELRTDVHGLIEVVNDLLLTAEVDRETDAEPIALAPVVAEALDGLGVLAAQRDIQLNLVCDTDAEVRGRATSLRRCVVALVDNAIAHSPDGAMVQTRVHAHARQVTVEVSDSGAGIVGIHVDRVFDRFAHSVVDGRQRGGFGIGLALARDVANRYGGQVAVTRTGPDGTVITMTLPRA